MTTQDNKYRPTTAEKKLLDIMLNPEHRYKNKKDICFLAKVNRTTYYKAVKKEGFIDHLKQESKALVDEAIPAVVNSVIREAVRGNWQQQKIVLEMAGLHTDELSLTSPADRPVLVKVNYVKSK